MVEYWSNAEVKLETGNLKHCPADGQRSVPSSFQHSRIPAFRFFEPFYNGSSDI
jgi:hypothetical protein